MPALGWQLGCHCWCRLMDRFRPLDCWEKTGVAQMKYTTTIGWATPFMWTLAWSIPAFAQSQQVKAPSVANTPAPRNARAPQGPPGGPTSGPDAAKPSAQPVANANPHADA